MKVLLCATSTLPDRMGGGERVIWALARGLATQGHEPRILVPRTMPGLPATSHHDGVTILRYRDPVHSVSTLYLPSLLLARAAVRTALRAWRPDVIHAQQGISGLAAVWAGARPLCYTFFGPWHMEFLEDTVKRNDVPGWKRLTRPLWAPAKAALVRRIEGAAVRQSNRVIVLSTYSARQLASIHRVAGSRVSLIPGGVDLGHFSPAPDRRAVRESLGLPPQGPLLFTVRRLVPRMGLEGLLRALSALPGATLVIGGEGWTRPRLEEAARALGVAERVRFRGFIPEEKLPQYYQAADLVVLPSIALEGFGLITVEALACGTPVVATPASGAEDVLAPLDPAWLSADTSPEAVAHAIRAALDRLTADPAIRDRCRAHAVAYSWERIVERYEEIYQSLRGAG